MCFEPAGDTTVFVTIEKNKRILFLLPNVLFSRIVGMSVWFNSSKMQFSNVKPLCNKGDSQTVCSDKSCKLKMGLHTKGKHTSLIFYADTFSTRKMDFK